MRIECLDKCPKGKMVCCVDCDELTLCKTACDPYVSFKDTYCPSAVLVNDDGE